MAHPCFSNGSDYSQQRRRGAPAPWIPCIFFLVESALHSLLIQADCQGQARGPGFRRSVGSVLLQAAGIKHTVRVVGVGEGGAWEAGFYSPDGPWCFLLVSFKIYFTPLCKTYECFCHLFLILRANCVSSGGSMVGLMVTSSKRVYAIPSFTAPRAPALQPSTADLYRGRRHSNTVLAQSQWGLWVLVCTRFVWALQASLAGMGFNSKHDFALPAILLGLLLCPWTQGTFFLVGSDILLLMLVQ